MGPEGVLPGEILIVGRKTTDVGAIRHVRRSGAFREAGYAIAVRIQSSVEPIPISSGLRGCQPSTARARALARTLRRTSPGRGGAYSGSPLAPTAAATWRWSALTDVSRPVEMFTTRREELTSASSAAPATPATYTESRVCSPSP